MRGENVARMGKMRNVNKILVWKPEGKRTFGRPKCRWEDSNRVNLKEICWEGVDWIRLVQDRNQWRVLVTTEMNLRVSKKAGNFSTS
jgi:hypothetical protein